MSFVGSSLNLGEVVRIGEYDIRPLVRISQIRTRPFGLVWYRPLAVEVKKSDGSLEIIQIRDRTRLLQVIITILFTSTAWLIFQAFRRSC